jgi:uncharacterized protein YjbJ (UPF0337 family)
MTPREKEAKDQEKAAEKAGDEAAQAVKDETGIGEKPPSDPQVLREEIEETREELGETVEAVSQKADVKGQVKEKVAERKEQLRGTQERVKAKLNEATGRAKETTGRAKGQAKERPAPVGAVAGGLLAALVLLWLIRRR